MNPDFDLVLENCLASLRSGNTLENCLSSYPEQAQELRPLLTAAEQVRTVPMPRARPEAVEANRERMFAALERQNWAKNSSKVPVSNSGLSRYTERIWNFLRMVLIGKENAGMKLALRVALDLVIFLAVAGAYTLNASASTLPGDPLYGMKRTWEEVRLTLSTSYQARQQLQAQLEAERRSEIEKLIQLRRPVFVEFEGNLEQMSSDTWVVNGLQFKMLPETIVQGTPAVGQRVWLQASIQADGQMIVREAHVENTPYPGFGPLGTLMPQVQSTSASLPAIGITTMPGQMHWSTPWGNQSPVRTPVPGQWMNTMPHNYNDYHDYNGPSSTSAPTAVSSQPAAPTSQYHDHPATIQQPSDNHHQDPNQCSDCSHNNNWDNHGGGSHGGWGGGYHP